MFAYTILYVTDVTKSIEFYEKTFGLKRAFITPENDYGELITESTKLAFASIQLANSNLKKGFQRSLPNDKAYGIEIAFTTNDVENTLKKAIEAGGVLYEKTKIKSWGQTVAYIQDINGFLVEICTSMES